MGKFIDLTNKKFGKWTVLNHIKYSHWLCRCECGIEKKLISFNLRKGTTKSCGCEKSIKHGLYNTSIYSTWKRLKKSSSLEKEWLDFEAFYVDMGDRPKGMYLIRKNRELKYSKDNCRWSNIRDYNKKHQTFLTYNGIRKHKFEWAKELDISRNVINNRIHLKLPIEKILKEIIPNVSKYQGKRFGYMTILKIFDQYNVKVSCDCGLQKTKILQKLKKLTFCGWDCKMRKKTENSNVLTVGVIKYKDTKKIQKKNPLNEYKSE